MREASHRSVTPVSARLTRCLKPRCCRDAMLRIGPTYYNHTPYARVHNAFLPLFEDAIRLHRCLGGCKVTVFWDVSRLRIVLSSDANMADGTCNERRVSRQQISSPERPKGGPVGGQSIACCRDLNQSDPPRVSKHSDASPAIWRRSTDRPTGCSRRNGYVGLETSGGKSRRNFR